jgi:hypothetical protein
MHAVLHEEGPPMRWSAFLLLFACPGVAASATEARLHRAVNLNGPALTIDGRAWEAGNDAKDVKITGKTFENQKVRLKPPTDAARTQMIRSSVWGDKVDIEFTHVPDGPCQVVLYVWEDNHNERFSLLVNGVTTLADFESGTEGMWKRLGPWPAQSVNGTLVVTARAASHGAANLSGVELWAGDGPLPESHTGEFVETPRPEQTAFFENKIRPVLAEHCYECHSATAKKVKGGLVLDSRRGVMKGGDTGPAITPGDPDASLLIQAVRHLHEDTAMPPKKKLPPHVIADLEAWVRMGAPDPRLTDTVAAVEAKTAIDWTTAREWWSFRPLVPPAPPGIKDKSWPANELDHFILAKIEAAGLKPAPEADAHAFIRRATYDLTGLPPTPQEVNAFAAAYIQHPESSIENLVERLLDSPRYGERWGRHWLDVVRYADTAGDNSDYPIPQMHRYRDWVINAFNHDLPYDQFVRQQLAGDLLPDTTPDQVIATGYIANARRFGSRVDDYPQHLTIEDTLDNVGRAFLGLTINCTRCHDHKFDPITTQDYYALYGIFNSTRYPWPGIELDKKQRDLVPLVPRHQLDTAAKMMKDREIESSRLNKEVKRLETAIKEKKGDKNRLEAELAQAKAAAKQHAQKPLPFELAYAVAEGRKIGDVAVQQKGDPAKPGPVVRRHFLTVFGGQKLPADDATSGRLQLADWIMARDNPLPARVMANRLWLNHFGKGIVPTPNDFGKQGKPATHPELLDYLAAKFRDSGWSIKGMHRLIMLSRTYRMSTLSSEEALARDPSNELLSSFPRRRLDAESMRDTLLMLGGSLDLSPAGPHPFPPQNDWGFTQHKPFKAVYETNHRSVYLMTQRIQRHPYLAIFDGADPSTSTPARLSSTTPLQALYWLNDPLVHDQSRKLAERIVKSGSDDRTRIRQAYELLFARPPDVEEMAVAARFLVKAGGSLPQDEAWHSLVRVLFRLNEFVYLD